MSDAVIDQSNDTGVRTALGTLMIERGFLDVDKLDEALRVGSETGERLGEVVVRMGWASEDDLAKILADQWHLRYVERSEITFNGDALSRMSREEATRLEALPIQINEDGAIVVALAEPTDARLLALHSLLGDRIDCVVVAKTAIDAGLRSDLLQKDGSSIVFTPHEPANTDPNGSNGEASVDTPVEAVRTVEPTPSPSVDSTVAAADGTATDFDEVARTLSDGLSSQLASLRQIVVEAEERRERDSTEIARLTAELSDRNSQLAEQSTTIQSMKQSLRQLADSFD
jgi:chromosome segregation ATPase